MSRQFAEQIGAQTLKIVGEILFNGELPGQLSINRFDQLADGVVKIRKGLRDLLFLVRFRNGAQGDPVFLP